MRMLSTVVAVALAVAVLPPHHAESAWRGPRPGAQYPPPPPVDPIHKPFDEILDTYVRDGLVYYRAFQIERAKFDRYLAAISAVTVRELEGWPLDRQLAYWINVYNAIVLRTVIDHYPIRG